MLWNFVFLISTVLLFSCEGPAGPPGPPGTRGQDGQDGLDGDSFLGSVFEIQDNFTSENNYELFFEFPETVEVFSSDIVLVYILWEQYTDSYGELLDVWRLLPQTVFLEEGTLQYNYDYTYYDVLIFLDGTIDFASLLPAETDNQVFRIVVLPADYAQSKSLDVSDYDAVMKTLRIDHENIIKIDM
jgi:hypothetical protein